MSSPRTWPDVDQERRFRLMPGDVLQICNDINRRLQLDGMGRVLATVCLSDVETRVFVTSETSLLSVQRIVDRLGWVIQHASASGQSYRAAIWTLVVIHRAATEPALARGAERLLPGPESPISGP